MRKAPPYRWGFLFNNVLYKCLSSLQPGRQIEVISEALFLTLPRLFLLKL